jgi:hypothetical protein
MVSWVLTKPFWTLKSIGSLLLSDEGEGGSGSGRLLVYFQNSVDVIKLPCSKSVRPF